MVLLLITGCKPIQPVIVPQVHSENNNSMRDNRNIARDSVYTRDSIYVLIRHDTTYIYKDVIRYKYYIKIDSVLQLDSVHIIDSIPYPVEVIKPVPVKNGYTRFTSWFFWIVTILLLCIVAFWICDKIPATKPYTSAIKMLFRIVK